MQNYKVSSVKFLLGAVIHRPIIFRFDQCNTQLHLQPIASLQLVIEVSRLCIIVSCTEYELGIDNCRLYEIFNLQAENDTMDVLVKL